MNKLIAFDNDIEGDGNTSGVEIRNAICFLLFGDTKALAFVKCHFNS